MGRRQGLLLALALVAAVVGAYVPALQAGFVWNDDTYVTDNPTLDGADGLGRIWTDPKANEQYYPLVFTSYWIEKRLWGLHPFGYHLVNVLLHAGAALLLGRLLSRLGLPAAWLAAAAFALHPVCVESVAWVTERKNTLSLVLCLVAAHAWLTWREGARARVPSRWWTLALASFTLALFAKTTASVLPAVLLVLVWWKDGRVRWSDVRPLVPFFAVGTALAGVTAWLERTMVQATGAEWSLDLPSRVVLAGQVVAFYGGKLLLPTGLAFIYPRWAISARDLPLWIPAIVALGLVAAAAALRGRIGRGPLAALLLFGGVLFPAMGFFNVYAMRFSYVADHFAYQAVAIGTAAVVCGIAGLLAGATPAARKGALGFALVVLAAFGTLVFRESRAYASEETLWRTTIARNPGCYMCETNYGHLLSMAGRPDEAVEHLERALELRPENVPALLNLGRIEEERGRYESAAAALGKARRLDPGDALVRVNLGNVLVRARRPEEAVAEYREALRLASPSDFLAHNGLGVALMQLGRPAEAIEHFRTAVALRPDYEEGAANLERALSLTGGARR